MKKKILISLLAIIMCFALIGCGTKQSNNNSNGNNNNSQNNNGNNNEDPKKDDPKKEETDSLSILEPKKEYDNDIPLGLENNYLKVNGNDIVVRVQTSGSTKQQENGPYYIYYNVYVGNDNLGLKCVRDAIYHLEGYGITMLKEFNEEEDVGVNFEFFEWDMTSSVHKGIDKEYAAISIPAGTEDKSQASLLITTDDGKKVLNPALTEIELEEHSITMNNNKAIDTKTDNVYKITNATGKTYNFGEFRHL